MPRVVTEATFRLKSYARTAELHWRPKRAIGVLLSAALSLFVLALRGAKSIEIGLSSTAAGVSSTSMGSGALRALPDADLKANQLLLTLRRCADQYQHAFAAVFHTHFPA